MSALSSSAVTIEDGEITIAAHLLAQKLGLSVEALKAEMRRGYVDVVDVVDLADLKRHSLELS